ncbi:MAG: protein-L-isoaspartate(D-aspartate) O-methyltransferase [Proteobacteria bacterium]|nr:protein-L-isoaspartate(D-aspartate) O-methyltransferase [Pseudomonadota bacterium]
MIELLTSKGIHDARVLQVMKDIPRSLFVPEILHERAFSDHPLPIGHEQTISQPFIVALMTEELQLKGTEKVLEIGTGSGYQSAILSKLCRSVFSIERIQPLAIKARQTLEGLGIHNVSIKYANGYYGWKEYGPFDRIIVTAAMTEEPHVFFDQLVEGGILVAPVEDADGKQWLCRYQKQNNQWNKKILCACSFVPFVV